MDGTQDHGETAREARLRFRRGEARSQTSGVAPGYAQGNLAILPAELAADFKRFCELNPKPCPLLAASAPGDPRLPALGEDLDIRTDLPLYRVWRDGEMVEETPDISQHWRDDLVAFVIGCSFSFEQALLEDGIRLRHIENGTNVPMWRTSIQTAPAGPFRGPMVVSMRPLSPADAIRAIQVTSRFAAVHGAPVHIGLPGEIGITDLTKPDYGDAVEVEAGELPVFWACGVTPQEALLRAKLPLAVTHAPGHMFVSDLSEGDLRWFREQVR
jgi:uncharacterized protein YcsI (UPF0317 family)